MSATKNYDERTTKLSRDLGRLAYLHENWRRACFLVSSSLRDADPLIMRTVNAAAGDARDLYYREKAEVARKWKMRDGRLRAAVQRTAKLRWTGFGAANWVQW